MNADQAKFLAEFYANTMQGEFPATCKVLAAVPDDKRDYKPDSKSRNAWELTTHLALGDCWFLDSIMAGSFKFDPAVEKQMASRFASVKDVVAFYEREYPARLAKIRQMPAEELTRTVDFFGMMQMPAAAYLSFANNHGIHHRGQLAAYLRAMGSKVPAIYGASADEPIPAAVS
jgi:uncharacterized damage-inducible protein DinB